jgi:hypothetical protein
VENWLVLREMGDEMRRIVLFFLTQAVCCSVWPSQFGDSGSWLLGLDVQGQRKGKKGDGGTRKLEAEKVQRGRLER